MCKKGVYVTLKNESGRLTNLKVSENDEKKIVGTFTGRGCSQGREVAISEVTPANKKAEKVLMGELQSLKAKILKLSRTGAKLCPA